MAGSEAFAYNGRSLYGVDLATGALSSLGNTPRQLFGIAVAPVPEPATWAMMILGFGAVGYTMRRRTARVRPAQLV
ncbi:PEPxxWA-CTERM sorting domain-containing protein [Sphingomonas sp. RHCKR7]|nr:PEPxxWA-CTERM sorting domain-containing protein [Sphingomonas folli]